MIVISIIISSNYTLNIFVLHFFNIFFLFQVVKLICKHRNRLQNSTIDVQAILKFLKRINGRSAMSKGGKSGRMLVRENFVLAKYYKKKRMEKVVENKQEKIYAGGFNTDEGDI